MNLGRPEHSRLCPTCQVYSRQLLTSLAFFPFLSYVLSLNCLLSGDVSQLPAAPSSSHPSHLVCGYHRTCPSLLVPCAFSDTRSQGLASPILPPSRACVPGPGDVYPAPPASVSRDSSRLPMHWPVSLLKGVRCCLQDTQPHRTVTANMTLLLSSQGYSFEFSQSQTTVGSS